MWEAQEHWIEPQGLALSTPPPTRPQETPQARPTVPSPVGGQQPRPPGLLMYPLQGGQDASRGGVGPGQFLGRRGRTWRDSPSLTSGPGPCQHLQSAEGCSEALGWAWTASSGLSDPRHAL